MEKRNKKMMNTNSSCSLYPACKELIGDCCPTIKGMMLGCCSIKKIEREVEREECWMIPINNPVLKTIGKYSIEFLMILYIIKVIITKNLNKDNRFLKMEKRSYTEIFITLIWIWFLCGQAAAGLTTLLYAKGDKRLMNAMGYEVDEVDVYTPRFTFDEFVAVPLRYYLWGGIWLWAINKFEIEENFEFSCKGFKFVFLKGLFWGLNVFGTMTIAAAIIAYLNVYLWNLSPLVMGANAIHKLNMSCLKKFLIVLSFRISWEALQIWAANYILTDKEGFKKLLTMCCKGLKIIVCYEKMSIYLNKISDRLGKCGNKIKVNSCCCIEIEGESPMWESCVLSEGLLERRQRSYSSLNGEVVVTVDNNRILRSSSAPMI